MEKQTFVVVRSIVTHPLSVSRYPILRLRWNIEFPKRHGYLQRRERGPKESLNFPIHHGISRKKTESEQLTALFDNIRNKVSFVLRSFILSVFKENYHYRLDLIP
jgi:hypothetical protein